MTYSLDVLDKSDTIYFWDNIVQVFWLFGSFLLRNGWCDGQLHACIVLSMKYSSVKGVKWVHYLVHTVWFISISVATILCSLSVLPNLCEIFGKFCGVVLPANE